MKNMIEISREQALQVYGGRDEYLARFLEYAAECIGAFAKLVYLTGKMRRLMLFSGRMGF